MKRRERDAEGGTPLHVAKHRHVDEEDYPRVTIPDVFGIRELNGVVLGFLEADPMENPATYVRALLVCKEWYRILYNRHKIMLACIRAEQYEVQPWTYFRGLIERIALANVPDPRFNDVHWLFGSHNKEEDRNYFILLVAYTKDARIPEYKQLSEKMLRSGIPPWTLVQAMFAVTPTPDYLLMVRALVEVLTHNQALTPDHAETLAYEFWWEDNSLDARHIAAFHAMAHAPPPMNRIIEVMNSTSGERVGHRIVRETPAKRAWLMTYCKDANQAGRKLPEAIERWYSEQQSQQPDDTNKTGGGGGKMD